MRRKPRIVSRVVIRERHDYKELIRPCKATLPPTKVEVTSSPPLILQLRDKLRREVEIFDPFAPTRAIPRGDSAEKINLTASHIQTRTRDRSKIRQRCKYGAYH